MRNDLEYGFFKIEIDGESGNFKLRVWDRHIQPLDKPIGPVICEKGKVDSLESALVAAAECIAKITGSAARANRIDIRPHLQEENSN